MFAEVASLGQAGVILAVVAIVLVLLSRVLPLRRGGANDPGHLPGDW